MQVDLATFTAPMANVFACQSVGNKEVCQVVPGLNRSFFKPVPTRYQTCTFCSQKKLK